MYVDNNFENVLKMLPFKDLNKMLNSKDEMPSHLLVHQVQLSILFQK